MQGLFLCNKPSGPSSAQFLNELKRTLSIPRSTRVGHGGTLDPFAEGLLVVGISRAYTKQLNQTLLHETKEYEAQIILGANSDTDDLQGKIQKSKVKIECITKNKIVQAVQKIQEREMQTPPHYSAIKIEGKAAYARARAGENFSPKPKKVELLDYRIEKIELKNDLIILDIFLTVSAGFYIRSFARDLGEVLETGGYVDTLKRVKIGDFSLKNALNLDDFGKTMTLYLSTKDPSQNALFLEYVSQVVKEENLPLVKEKNVLKIEGNFDKLQNILAQIDIFAKQNNITDIQNWFGK